MHARSPTDWVSSASSFIRWQEFFWSAYGIAIADIKTIRDVSWLEPLGQDFSVPLRGLEETARSALVEQGVLELHITIKRSARLRTAGSDTSLEISISSTERMRRNSTLSHLKRFGYLEDRAEIIVDALVAEAIGQSSDPEHRKIEAGRETSSAGSYEQRETSAFESYHGPQLIFSPPPRSLWRRAGAGDVRPDGTIVMRRDHPLQRGNAIGTTVDPVQLEIFNNLFMAIAEEMGVALQSTASSVNIKERLDFSCAIFDPEGALIANAPHIPVHLGSMGESVRRILEIREEMKDSRGILRGDAYVLNDPYRGGTHLPDITIIVPVFYGDENAPSAFVAARGHHSDIGGIAPGSMPPDSTSILTRRRSDRQFSPRRSRTFPRIGNARAPGSGEWPARNPDRNISDLKAQLAACSRGAEMLIETAREYGRETVSAYMNHVLSNAEESVRRLLNRLDDGEFDYEMDNKAHVRVRILVDKTKRSATFDFQRTSDELPDNFNAPYSIVRAASLYVVRTLIDDLIPMNDGCLRPIELRVREGSMLKPTFPAAVVAGNVETSQVVTDTLLAATGQLAPSQGTMNNFTFGNDRYQYYETIAGGSGAGPGHDGTSAVQTHMTNSRLTDPEILETRFPVRLERFAIRRGSGGEGAHRGGDGVIRSVMFLETMRANILANRRRVAPRGILGGADGALGRNFVERADGTIEMLTATASAQMEPGDRFVIETPGGGGFGEKVE